MTGGRGFGTGLVGSFADCDSEEDGDESLTGPDPKDDERGGGAVVVAFVAGGDSSFFKGEGEASGESREELLGGE